MSAKEASVNRVAPAARFLARRSRTLLSCAAARLLPAATVAQTLPTAQQVAAQIQVGWNVGGSLEAPSGETYWGSPAVSQTLIDAVHLQLRRRFPYLGQLLLVVARA